MHPFRAAREWIEKRFMGGQPLGFGSFAVSGLPSPILSGVMVTPETALTFSNCFACINVLSTDVAALPLEVKRRRPGKGSVSVPRDPRYSLVYCEPNANTTSMRFRQALYGHKHGWGNGYAEIKRFKGMPVELVLHSPRATDTWPERAKNGSLWYQVDAGRRQVRAEDMIHIAGLGWNGLLGYSVISLHRQAIGFGLAIQTNGAAFHGNALTPKGVISLQKKLSLEAQANLRESLAAVHSGPENAHRVMILEEGMTFTGISISMLDAQFIESAKMQALEMNRIFRVPPHKTMDYSQTGSAYRALEESNQDYIDTTLGPEIEGVEQEFNRKLFTSRERAHGLHVSHDLSKLLRGDMKTRARYLYDRMKMGSITPNQIAEREGDAPVDDAAGNRYYVSNEFVPIEMAGMSPAPTTPEVEAEMEDDADAGATALLESESVTDEEE